MGKLIDSFSDGHNCNCYDSLLTVPEALTALELLECNLSVLIAIENSCSNF